MKPKRFVTGRRITVAKYPKTSRDVIRRHLREEGKTISGALAPAWQVHPHTAYKLMYDRNRALSPFYIDTAIEVLRLDEFDALELRTLGAIESGWQLPPPKGI